MLTAERDHYFEILAAAAEQLTEGVHMPVEILEVCERLQLKVNRHKSVARNRARLVQTSGGPEIQLPTELNATLSLTVFERFLIAHEVGHFILAQQCNAAPLGPSEYWQHEALCDRFASLLLLPSRLVEHALKAEGSPLEILCRLRSLASWAEAPETIVERRACMVNTNLAILRLARLPGAIFKVVNTALANGKEKGRTIPVESRLGRALRMLTEQTKEVVLERPVFDEFVIPSCVGALEGVAILEPTLKILMVVRRDSAPMS